MKRISIKKDFKKDYITRAAGERLRHLILKICESGEKIELDFSGLVIASTSFFDESIAKLSEYGWDQKKVSDRIIFREIHPKDKQVLEKMCSYRGLKINSSPR